MKTSFTGTSLAAVLLSGCLTTAVSAENPNSLSEQEQKAGFKLLFDGEGLDGWQHGGNWVVKEGVITRTGKGGSLVYKTASIPDDFELRFHWKVGRGSNSGIYYRPGQYEYQILDNKVHADGKNPRTSAASLYFCMAPSHDATNPVGEWNSGRVICKGTVVQHWLNGKKVIDLNYAKSKWAWNVDLLGKRGGDLTARGAHLSLQDHGDPIWYSGIKLRVLAQNDQLDRTPITPQKIPNDVLQAEKKKIDGIVAQRKKQTTKPQRKKQEK
jgi:hypothetical protein